MITAALTGQLDNAPYRKHPIFNVDVPTTCPGCARATSSTRVATWPEAQGYDEQARKLAAMFADNFKRFETGTWPVRSELAGPRA